MEGQDFQFLILILQLNHECECVGIMPKLPNQIAIRFLGLLVKSNLTTWTLLMDWFSRRMMRCLREVDGEQRGWEREGEGAVDRYALYSQVQSKTQIKGPWQRAGILLVFELPFLGQVTFKVCTSETLELVKYSDLVTFLVSGNVLQLNSSVTLDTKLQIYFHLPR